MHPFECALFSGIEDEERVEVPVAGVEHIEHDHVVAVADLVDLFEDVGQLGLGTTVSCR